MAKSPKTKQKLHTIQLVSVIKKLFLYVTNGNLHAISGLFLLVVPKHFQRLLPSMKSKMADTAKDDHVTSAPHSETSTGFTAFLGLCSFSKWLHLHAKEMSITMKKKRKKERKKLKSKLWRSRKNIAHCRCIQCIYIDSDFHNMKPKGTLPTPSLPLQIG